MSDGLTAEQRDRYSRQLMIDLIDTTDQGRLLDAKVLVVGVGGLGSPVIQYLAAAGIGRLGFVDSGRIKRSNLQRQVIHAVGEVGKHKVESARRFVERLNPDVDTACYQQALTAENAESVIDGYDVVVDCVDNFHTRFLLNDITRLHTIPLVHGAIYGFDGQAMTFRERGPCYRCLVPSMPDTARIPSGESMGIFPPVPGVIGSVQANEALKLVLEIGEVLDDRLLRFHGLASRFSESSVTPDPACPVCGEEGIEDIEGIDYDGDCAVV